MKNLDLISKRILIFSLSISAVLLSTSLLIFVATPANANVPPAFSNSPQMNDGRRYDAIATPSSPYFLIWDTQTGASKTISPNNNLTDKNNF